MPADRGGPVAAGPPIRPRPPAPAPPRVVANPDNQVQSPRPQGAPPSHTDITSSGPGYGSARANAYKATPAYKQAVAHVFSIQPTAQKAAIIAGLTRQNAFHTPEYVAVRSVWDHMALPDQQKIVTVIPHDIGRFIAGASKSILEPVAGAAKDVAGLLNFHPGGSLGPGNALTFGTSSNAQRAQILNQGTSSLLNKLPSLDTNRNIGTLGGSPVGQQLRAGVGGAGTAAAGGVRQGVDALRNLRIGFQAPGSVQAQGGLGPAVGKAVVNTPLNIAAATAQDPSVIPKTIKGLASDVVAMTPALAQIPLNMITQGPGAELSSLGKQVSADYTRRYGGSDQAQIARFKKEGAGPEVFDALGLAGGLDATLGRAAADLGRTGRALTGKENFLTRERPNLMVSGGKSRPQELARTAGRIVAQRAEDQLRRGLAKVRPGELRQPSLESTGVLRPAPKTIAPIFRHHAIRVTHSAIEQHWRRPNQDALQREVRGLRGSARSAINRLNNWQQRAIYHTIQGMRVDTPEHFAADLQARADEIINERATNPGSLGNRVPAQHVDQVEELRLIQKLIPNAEKIAGPKMVAFQRSETARALRIEGASDMNAATAEARRWRTSPAARGIEHPDVTVDRQIAQLRDRETHIAALVREPGTVGELHAARAALKRTQARIKKLSSNEDRPARLAAYSDKVRARARAQGYPEPGYFPHRINSDIKFGDYATGGGGRAMPADKHSEWQLHTAGVADHSPDAYLGGLARSIKRPFQHRMTDEQFRAAYIGTPTPEEIKAALGYNKAPRLLTGHELRQVHDFHGYDRNHLVYYNPGRLEKRTLEEHGLLAKKVEKGKAVTEPHEEQLNAEIDNALNQDDVVQKPDVKDSHQFLTTTGWKAVPKTAFDEIQGGLRASSLGGRVVGKVQGATAGAILAQNPHFVAINTLAHAFPAIMGTKGAIIPDLFKMPFWYHGLDQAGKDLVNARAGGRASHMGRTANLGSQAPNEIAAFGRQLASRGLVQQASRLNPFGFLLKAENAQSQFFRRAVFYHEAKRMAFQDMGREYGRAVAGWEQIKHIFDLGPQDRIKAIVNDQAKIEALGRTAVNLLGDYGRFTVRERRFLNNRAVMFYSFLRHVTRTLLYVLPVRHPLAFGIMGELGNLHVQEVKKLLGGQDLPWAYGRMFFKSGGKLSSIDLTSASPISSPLVDVASGGVKQLPRLLSPLVGSILDIAYGKTPEGTPVKQNLWSLANQMGSLSYLYRQVAAAHGGLAPQQSDSFPFLHDRPAQFKTKKAQDYAAAKAAARGPLSQYLLGSALGLYPKPDDSAVIAAHQAAAAAAKGRGRKGSGIPGWGGGSSGGAPGWPSPGSGGKPAGW